MTPEQLEARRNFIGASEVAAVCGLDIFRGPLDVWASKRGLLPHENSDEAEIGNLLEIPLLQRYTTKTGLGWTKPTTKLHPTISCLAATPDAITNTNKNVQVKVVGRYMAHHWDKETTPEYVVCQSQTEMAVWDLKETDVVALVGGTDYRILPLERDDTTIGYLIEICERFWHDHVLADKPPELSGENARRILSARFPNILDKYGEANEEFIKTARTYQDIGKQIKALEEERDKIGHAMCLAIGELPGYQWNGGRAQWKMEGGKPSYKAVCEELKASPDLIKKHTGAGQRTLRVYFKDKD